MAILSDKARIANNKVKLPKSMTFDRTRSKLKIFLINIEMHIEANQIIYNKKKIIFIASCFINTVAEQI